jgi:hypothetical protein
VILECADIGGALDLTIRNPKRRRAALAAALLNFALSQCGRDVRAPSSIAL